MICRICNNAKDNKTYKVREMALGLKDVFEYYQCSECGCLQISDTEFDVSRYYPEDYYSFTQPDTSKTPKMYIKLVRAKSSYIAFKRGVIGKFLHSKYKFKFNKVGEWYIDEVLLNIMAKAGLKIDSKVLDVGCGAGFSTYAYKVALGLKHISGVDPLIKNDIEYPNGLKIYKKYLHDVEGKWDLITFIHSFEHIKEQHETLKVVSDMLSPNGRCLIVIPTVSSYAWEHYRENWVQLDAPRHFYVHSTQSMKVLAEKAKMRVAGTFYNSGTLQFWGSEQYLLDIPLFSEKSYAKNTANSVFTFEQMVDFYNKALQLDSSDMGDVVCFYLENKKQQ